MEKLSIKYPIIVEGKYDKITLSSVVDGVIITTDGFGVFKNHEKMCLLRRLALESPVILLTDSDGGGKVIRSHITEAIPKDRLIQLYVPQIKGRERRKTENSAEGYLGVEGMEASVLRDLLSPFATEGGVQRAPITKLDFYEQGLTGAKNSSERRDRLAQKLGLPKKMTANALLEAVRIICTAERFFELCGEI